MAFNGHSVERDNRIADFKFDEIIYDTIQEILTGHPDMNIDTLRSNITIHLVEFLLDYQKSFALHKAHTRINAESIRALELKQGYAFPGRAALETQGSTE